MAFPLWGLSQKKVSGTLRAIETPAFIEAGEFQTPFFWQALQAYFLADPPKPPFSKDIQKKATGPANNLEANTFRIDFLPGVGGSSWRSYRARGVSHARLPSLP